MPEDAILAFNNCPGLRDLNLWMSASEIMTQGEFQGRKTLKDIVVSMSVSVRTSKELGARTVGVNSEDASRTDIHRLTDCALAAREGGAGRFRYCDTLGADDPITIYERIKELSLATNMALELHCHNDLGMAEAVSCAGGPDGS